MDLEVQHDTWIYHGGLLELNGIIWDIHIYIYNIGYTVYIYIDIYNHQSDMKLDNYSCLILGY